jgi:hypothetical protein
VAEMSLRRKLGFVFGLVKFDCCLCCVDRVLYGGRRSGTHLVAVTKGRQGYTFPIWPLSNRWFSVRRSTMM